GTGVGEEIDVLRRLIGLPRMPAGEGGTGGSPGAGSGRGPGGRSAPSNASGGSRSASPSDPSASGSWTEGAAAETATVRAIVAQLESMPPDDARFLAGFAS